MFFEVVFQFRKVQLILFDDAIYGVLVKFQFRKVQLILLFVDFNPVKKFVSIPQGPINTEEDTPIRYPDHVSIPQGPINTQIWA